MINLLDFIFVGISVIIALVLHELAHGFVSYKLGDPTPKMRGRLTLNPLAHLDPFGTLCLLFFHFGWAKPVEINPNYYKNQKVGTALVSLAGPCMNFILAIVGAVILRFTVFLNSEILISFLYTFVSINVGLGAFNLIPFPPLDGSKILAGILPQNLYVTYMRYEQYGMFFLMVLLCLGSFTPFLNTVMSGIMNLIFKLVGFV